MKRGITLYLDIDKIKEWQKYTIDNNIKNLSTLVTKATDHFIKRNDKQEDEA